MNKLIARTAASLALVTLAASMALAAPPKKAAAVACPACKMPLSAKKTKMDTVAVYIKGKTYYCCSGCKMDKSLTTKPKGGKK
jgi:YHS domain-containing protein